jgi:hypothetical protein
VGGHVAGGREPATIRSIEVHAFRDDGSSHTKTYFDMPEGSDYAAWTQSLA